MLQERVDRKSKMLAVFEVWRIDSSVCMFYADGVAVRRHWTAHPTALPQPGEGFEGAVLRYANQNETVRGALEREALKQCPKCGLTSPAAAARCACGYSFAATPSAGEASIPSRSTKAIRTHYDNLKVTRDAPLEVIRAAYRALSKKYHPDRRSNDPEAARVMRLLNAAYEALSDPLKRRQHDEWIAQSEQRDVARGYAPAEVEAYGMPASGVSSSARRRRRWAWFAGGASALAAVFSVVAALRYEVGGGQGSESVAAVRWAEEVHAPVSAAAPRMSSYVRRPLAPNGMPWPEATGYVEGYAKLRTDGSSSVVLDNSHSSADVFVKVFTLDAVPPLGVRAVFIKAGEAFRVDTVRAGTYEVRYRDLDSGAVSRSAPFILAELPEAELSALDDMAILLVPGMEVEGVEAEF